MTGAQAAGVTGREADSGAASAVKALQAAGIDPTRQIEEEEEAARAEAQAAWAAAQDEAERPA